MTGRPTLALIGLFLGALLNFFLRGIQFFRTCVFDRGNLVVGGLEREDQFGELDLQRLGVARLRILESKTPSGR